ncbi:MAG: hypothetical protein ACK4F6_06990 [Hylemonella sp.]
MTHTKIESRKHLIRPTRGKPGPPSIVDSSPSILELVAAHHANAIGCQTRKVVIEFPPMQHVSAACSSIFSNVDRDDPLQRAAARDAWLVKSSLMLTALPFDDPRLGLDEIMKRLEGVSASVPGIRSAVNDLARLVQHLASENVNPKRDRLGELLHDSNTGDHPVGILANVCGTPTPGWPTSVDAESDFGSADLELIRLRRQAKNSLYRRLIIPGNPWFAPRNLLFDLLYGGRTSDVVAVAYRSERVSIPAPRGLPSDLRFPRASSSALQTQEAVEIGEGSQLDKWAHESFWASIHAQHADIAPTSDRDVTVDAQFVLFADGSGTFLPADRRVVEVSSLFETGADFDITEDKLPRTLVRELEEGDLVMLRLSGSGDYLDDVADSLIQKAGETGLRSTALQWKDRLREVIKRHGEGVVAMKIRSLGVRLRSPQYLWAWAGDAVMAPHDRQTFHSLIAAILQLESPGSGDASADYADVRWDEMERLKAYHHKAGVAIRAALLTRVRELVAKRRRIDIAESIELPGVAAGRMGLLRVAAVDTKSRRVPMSTLFHLSKVKVTSWQG